MRYNFLLFVFVLMSNSIFCQTLPDSNHLKEKLIAAYPDFIETIENNYIIFKDGTRMIYDDKKIKNSAQKMDAADVEDQLNTVYPKGKTGNPPEFSDPGRIRNDAFFKKMYGATAKEVNAHLVEIAWLPGTAKKKLMVSGINGIDKKMQAISAELEKKPAYIAFVNEPGGTFNWRVIKGTNRPSTHSFGIAIDINTKYSNYWQWDNKTSDENKKKLHYRNKIPFEIIAIFEKYGFIWGGKWYHYDTMHFEYRPELL